jgi:hypothetical protein
MFHICATALVAVLPSLNFLSIPARAVPLKPMLLFPPGFPTVNPLRTPFFGQRSVSVAVTKAAPPRIFSLSVFALRGLRSPSFCVFWKFPALLLGLFHTRADLRRPARLKNFNGYFSLKERQLHLILRNNKAFGPLLYSSVTD